MGRPMGRHLDRSRQVLLGDLGDVLLDRDLGVLYERLIEQAYLSFPLIEPSHHYLLDDVGGLTGFRSLGCEDLFLPFQLGRIEPVGRNHCGFTGGDVH